MVACLAVAGFQDDIPTGLPKGRSFPDFLLSNVEGGFGRLSDSRGKKVLGFRRSRRQANHVEVGPPFWYAHPPKFREAPCESFP